MHKKEPSVVVNWEKKTSNRTVPTLQAVVNPMLRRGSPIHDAALVRPRKGTLRYGWGTDEVRREIGNQGYSRGVNKFWVPYGKACFPTPPRQGSLRG